MTGDGIQLEEVFCRPPDALAVVFFESPRTPLQLASRRLLLNCTLPIQHRLPQKLEAVAEETAVAAVAAGEAAVADGASVAAGAAVGPPIS